MTKLKWTLAILIIFCGFFYFSNPEGIVINEKGRIEGVGNKLRALFQGRMFWDLQYTLATITLRKINEPGESFSSRMQGLDKNFKEMRDSIDEITNSYLSPNQKQAKTLRRKADSLEKAAYYMEMDEMSEAGRLRRVHELNLIISIIDTKLSSSEKPPTFIFLIASLLVLIVLMLVTEYTKRQKKLKIIHSVSGNK